MERNILNTIELKLMIALDRQNKGKDITDDLLNIIDDCINLTKGLIETIISLKGE